MAEDLTGVGTAGPTDVELPRGLALNSVRVICAGEHLVTRFVKPYNHSSEWRRALEAEIGQAVFVGDEFAYTKRAPVPSAAPVPLPREPSSRGRGVVSPSGELERTAKDLEDTETTGR